ncbi:fil-1 [Pristionchus pacificus]|uniref:Fil-1 n=1 Tax=Pristionchus pacificus TaxID=54126 RepID=A0A2A6C326_PRIPA|nr:fil-1 [Pristionchus pacificus]|eukprot:PDM72433.1 fil-1 [Pristionchus pacificus]
MYPRLIISPYIREPSMHRFTLAVLLALHSPLFAANTESYKVIGPITQHFQDWLARNGYKDDFVRADNAGTQGSYGGKTDDSQKVTKTPVIFIHGNSDAALRQGFGRNDNIGWENTIDYFLKHGYTSAELYATSWGDTNPAHASSRTHDCATTQRLRRFLEAVIAYTGADQVSMVTHSMGVTLGRKIIKGGKITANDGNCDLGVPIRVVDVFVGLSGGNYGLCNCEGVDTMEPTCNKQDGLWPGDSCGMNYLDCGLTVLPFPCSGPTYSKFLTDLNNDMQQEAKRLVSGWSDSDDLIMYGTITWGKSTCLIPRNLRDVHTYGDEGTHVRGSIQLGEQNQLIDTYPHFSS